jgi:hypothetical protein
MDNKQLQQETSLVISKATTLTINNNKDYEFAGSMLVELKTYMKKVQDFWKDAKEAAHKAWKNICEKEFAMLEPLKIAEGEIKSKMAQYQREQEAKERAIREELERKQREEAERLLKEAQEKEAAGDKLGADLLLARAELLDQTAPVAAFQKATAKGVSSRKVWKARVVDETQVPTEFAGIVIRPVDVKALNELAKATKGKAKIPGVEFYEETIMSVRGNK